MSNTIKIKRRVSGSGNLGALAVGELGVNIDDNNKLYVGTSAGNKLTALPTSGGTLTGTLNAVGIIASSSVTAVGLTTSSGFTLTGGDAYFQGSGGVNFNGGPVSFSATAHISSTVKFAAGSSGTLAKRTGYDDFIGYNASYGSYIGGGAGNAARYLAAGGSFYDGSTWRTLYHTGNLPQYLPLAGGTLSGDLTVAGSCTFAAISGTTATFSGTITGHGSIDLQDNDKLLLGAGNDLEIYHDGSNSYIKNKIGWLNVPLSQNGMTLANSDFSEIVAKFMINNACELYYNGSKKFETTATGVSVSSSGNGKLGINTASPAKSLTVVYNTSTTLNTGESLAGAGSALGVLINNTNTTTNSFAGLDFRANDSDARLLWRHTASNRGQFEFVGDQNGSFNSHLIIKDTGYAEFSGNNDVRLTLGSTGTGGSNSAVFIRGNGTTLSFNSPGGNIVWENSGSEKMRLNASGNFGIGGQDPAMTLDVYRSVTGNWLSRIHNIATSGNSSGLLVRMDETGSSGMALGVNVNGSYKLVLKPNGNVGIGGTTAPAQTLHIAANGSGSTAVDNHGYGLRVQDTNSAHGAIDILQNGDTATFVSRSNVQGGYEFKSYASVGTATHVRLKIASNGDISFLDGAGSATFLWSRANGRLVLSKSDYQLQIQNGANIWFNKVSSSGSFAIHRNGVGDILSMGTGGTDINAHTHFRPYNNNQYTCGTSANRWSSVLSTELNLTGQIKSTSTTNQFTNNEFEKTIQVGFSNGVNNQKMDFYWTGTQSFWGRIEVEITDSYSNQNASGSVKAVYGVGVNAGNAVYNHERHYTESTGATGDNWALSDLRWDSSNSRYRITLVHRNSAGNSPTLKFKFFGTNATYRSNIEGFTNGSVYTSDSTSYEKPSVMIGVPGNRVDLNVQGNTSVSGDGKRLFVNSNDRLLCTLGNWGGSGADIDEGHLAMYSSGTETVRIATNADSFFNGGNVGLGRTPSACLDILDPTDGNISWSTFLRVGRRGGHGTNELELKSLHDGSDEVDGFAVFLHGGECLAVDNSKRLYLNALPPGTYADSQADDFVLGNTGDHGGLTIRSSSGTAGNIFFADGVNGDQKYRGYLIYDHPNERFQIGAGAAARLWVDTDGLKFAANHYIRNSDGIKQIRFKSTEVAFNEDGRSDVDVRMEGDTDANLFFLDSSTDRIGIGCTPSAKLHSLSSGTNYAAQFTTNSTTPYGVYIEASQSPASNIVDGYPLFKIAESGSGGIHYFSVSSGGNTTVGGHLAIQPSKVLYLDGGSNTYIYENSADSIGFVTGGTARAFVFNSGSADGIKIPTGSQLYFGDDTYQYSSTGTSLITVTDHGWIQIGPQNSSYCHIQTDRPQFYFNKQTAIAGHHYPYINNTYYSGSSSNRWHTVYGVLGNFTGSIQLTGSATPTSGAGSGKLYAYNDSNAMLYYKDGGNTAHALHSASDYRLKENITEYSGDDAVALVKAAQVKRFDFKENRCPEEHRMNRVGFLAHELQEAGCDLGAVVSLEKDAVDNLGNPRMQSVDYKNLVPVLWAALQDALKRIEELENK